MRENQDGSSADLGTELDELEQALEQVEAADAPEAAERAARLLGSALDDIDGGSESVSS